MFRRCLDSPTRRPSGRVRSPLIFDSQRFHSVKTHYLPDLLNRRDSKDGPNLRETFSFPRLMRSLIVAHDMPATIPQKSAPYYTEKSRETSQRWLS